MMVPSSVQGITGGIRRTIVGRLVAYLSLAIGILGLVGSASLAFAAPDVHSDGSDLALDVPSYSPATTTIDLRLATIGTWDQAGTGHGVYDPDKWVVVFKYTSVNIASGKTVNFINHPSGAPVVWLVRDAVRIDGSVSIVGIGYQNGSTANGGPGGFAGGRGYISESNRGWAGLGPGGGGYTAAGAGGAGYAFPGAGTVPGISYGNQRILPLFGGSGGGGRTNSSYGGGGGGGAILIACAGTVNIAGGVNADGGGSNAGGGSGGAIRIIANRVEGVAEVRKRLQLD